MTTFTCSGRDKPHEEYWFPPMFMQFNTVLLSCCQCVMALKCAFPELKDVDFYTIKNVSLAWYTHCGNSTSFYWLRPEEANVLLYILRLQKSYQSHFLSSFMLLQPDSLFVYQSALVLDVYVVELLRIVCTSGQTFTRLSSTHVPAIKPGKSFLTHVPLKGHHVSHHLFHAPKSLLLNI